MHINATSAQKDVLKCHDNIEVKSSFKYLIGGIQTFLIQFVTNKTDEY